MTEAVADAAIYERDDHACQHCGVTEPDSTSLTTWPIDSHPVRSSLVTVCSTCRGLLDGAAPAWRSTLTADVRGSLFSLLETTTETQGATVAEVASLATETTGGLESANVSAREAYLAARRDIYLALAVVDRQLDALDDVRSRAGGSSPIGGLEPTVRSRLETVVDLTRTLATHLRTATALAETAVVADGHCPICLEPMAERRADDSRAPNDGRCEVCSNERRATAEWEAADGTVDRTSLFRALSTRLEAASETTATLTDVTGTFAAQLSG